MEILNLPRGRGKTTYCIYTSYVKKIPILCVTNSQKKEIKESANLLKLHIPEPITVSDFLSENHPPKVIVDEGLLMLKALLGSDIELVTLTTYRDNNNV